MLSCASHLRYIMTKCHVIFTCLLSAVRYMSDPLSLLELLPEVLEIVGRAALANNLRDCLRFSQACKSLHVALQAVRLLAQGRRLQWLPELTTHHAIKDEARAVSGLGPRARAHQPWAAGGLLPTVGRSVFRVRVEWSDEDNGRSMCVGVCDAAARCCWALHLFQGELCRFNRDVHGNRALNSSSPEGYPDGWCIREGNYYMRAKQLMKAGFRCTDSDYGRANGAVIEVIVDHDLGALGFRVKDGPYLLALPLKDEDFADGNLTCVRVFPHGAPLRPFALCQHHAGDTMSFAPAYLLHVHV